MAMTNVFDTLWFLGNWLQRSRNPLCRYCREQHLRSRQRGKCLRPPYSELPWIRIQEWLHRWYCINIHIFTAFPPVPGIVQTMSPIGNLKTMAQGACAAGHAWFWYYRGLIVWSHALNKAVNMCFIYRNNSKRMDLKNFFLIGRFCMKNLWELYY